MAFLARSYLFVPGDRPDRFAKAAAAGADRVVLDLEDAVAPDRKQAAREAVADWFTQGGQGIVRINGCDTEWLEEDLRMIEAAPAAEIMLPKSDPAGLARLAGRLSERAVVALVETVAGLMGVRAVAAVPCVSRLAFGGIDFAVDSGIRGTGSPLDFVRSALVLESRFANLPPPIDGVTVALDDPSVLESDLERARDFGFGAKLCIHPRQVGLVNARFGPSPDEILWARRVLDAVGENEGVVALEGKMIDRPVLERARTIIAQIRETPSA